MNVNSNINCVSAGLMTAFFLPSDVKNNNQDQERAEADNEHEKTKF